MKRRNGDFCSKLRRPVKKSKLITEGFHGSNTFLYLKLLSVWSLVILADFISEFRFEYLWPFWLLIRSVYDSFNYQGLAFSIFFVLIALTSDMICFLFIPVHWLFFAASTYVWVQYVWHAERGICLPTISLWFIFVYIEASVRLKELKSLPFHLDLCRPFAAHCIGYPVVTLGFGFKSYVSYKMRLRKQKEVAKENEFYLELLQKALPQETTVTSNCADGNVISNGICSQIANNQYNVKRNSTSGDKNIHWLNQSNNISKLNTEYDTKQINQNGIDKHELHYMEHQIIKKISLANEFDEESEAGDFNHKNSFKNVSTSLISKSSQSSNSTNSISNNSGKWNHSSNHVNSNCNNSNSLTSVGNVTNKKSKTVLTNNLTPQKDENLMRLEADIKRLKNDLQTSRQSEVELRSQLNIYITGEKTLKAEISQLQQDNDSLQAKLQNFLTARQQDKQALVQLEKRLQEEKKSKASIESQLASEKKAKKAEEAAKVVAISAAAKTECTELCKNKKKDMESDLKRLKRDLKAKEDQIRALEREAQSLRQCKDSHGDIEVLMSALSAMQDKNAKLENSLSAETRLKLDLFSALGDTKRQLDISQAKILQRDQELDELKSKIAEVMAVMPSASSFLDLNSEIDLGTMLYNSKFLSDQSNPTKRKKSKPALDPNASVYTPQDINEV